MNVSDFGQIQPEKLNELAKEKGKEFAHIKTNQIRNFFGAVNSVRQMVKAGKNAEEIRRELILLQPKLAYAGGRKKEVKPFAEFMIDVIKSTVNAQKQDDAIKNFFAFVEALVAYHKFYDGRDN